MKQLLQTDLLPAAEYEQQREQFRSRIIALKQRRRISVGPLITLVFENRETLRFQTQEMIRVEHIWGTQPLPYFVSRSIGATLACRR